MDVEKQMAVNIVFTVTKTGDQLHIAESLEMLLIIYVVVVWKLIIEH